LLVGFLVGWFICWIYNYYLIYNYGMQLSDNGMNTLLYEESMIIEGNDEN